MSTPASSAAWKLGIVLPGATRSAPLCPTRFSAGIPAAVWRTETSLAGPYRGVFGTFRRWELQREAHAGLLALQVGRVAVRRVAFDEPVADRARQPALVATRADAEAGDRALTADVV